MPKCEVILERVLRTEIWLPLRCSVGMISSDHADRLRLKLCDDGNQQDAFAVVNGRDCMRSRACSVMIEIHPRHSDLWVIVNPSGVGAALPATNRANVLSIADATRKSRGAYLD